jgi:hypothetical protein
MIRKWSVRLVSHTEEIFWEDVEAPNAAVARQLAAAKHMDRAPFFNVKAVKKTEPKLKEPNDKIAKLEGLLDEDYRKNADADCQRKKHRAMRLLALLEAEYHNGEERDNLVDLLVDVMHLKPNRLTTKEDFEGATWMAWQHHRAEALGID